MQNIDFAILDFIQEHIRCSFLDAIVPIITLLGEKGILMTSVGLIMLLASRYRRCGISVLLSLIASLMVGNLALKHIVSRARPCRINDTVQMLVAIPRDYSFPSGHSMCTFAAATVIFMFDKRLGIPALIIAALVALSRLYLYVHFPSDVLAGTIIGIAIGVFAANAVNLFFNKSGTGIKLSEKYNI